MITNIKLPLQIENGRLARQNNVVRAINDNVEALLSTALNSTLCDPEFGFTLQNFRFEIVNENQGTIYNQDNDDNPLYKKKISGTSKNVQTFASDLDMAIRKYEHRLRDTSSTLTYVAQSRSIVIVVKGVIIDTNENYMYTTQIKLWTLSHETDNI